MDRSKSQLSEAVVATFSGYTRPYMPDLTARTVCATWATSTGWSRVGVSIITLDWVQYRHAWGLPFYTWSKAGEPQ